ncbi:pentapeptide repeat-containing protein [Actinomadura sp. NPDC049753]|uniref:pentapeptide repeat-containing protein n=1 Tax=Actinomadura sp. NPDC049753 TaxID=3154739 RepID=UPI0034449A72
MGSGPGRHRCVRFLSGRTVASPPPPAQPSRGLGRRQPVLARADMSRADLTRAALGGADLVGAARHSRHPRRRARSEVRAVRTADRETGWADGESHLHSLIPLDGR